LRILLANVRVKWFGIQCFGRYLPAHFCSCSISPVMNRFFYVKCPACFCFRETKRHSQ
jgi:hypothetical protein